jgi:predicted amidophosphoribosyltransferase
MVCLSCRGPGQRLCPDCLRLIQPALGLRTPGGVTVNAWAAHEGPARTLVRRLKYEGVLAVAELVAEDLARHIPGPAQCLVPVSRNFVRRVRYGVDPASQLASALSHRTGLPVVHALQPGVWGRANAGSRKDSRVPPRFSVRRRVAFPVLVDDVVTTGVTLDAAAEMLGGVLSAVTVTGVP